MPERKTDIKTLKMVYGDVRGSVPYWANEYRDRAALNPPDTNNIGQNIQKIKIKDALKNYSQSGKRCLGKAD